jgi:hypothetical protein
MKQLLFEWDKLKENANIKKHGVSFEEARTSFYDENAVHFFSPTIQMMKIVSFC